MKCEEMDWIGYEARALEPEQLKKIEDHLTGCAHCQKQWSDQRKTTGILKDVWQEAKKECVDTEIMLDLIEDRVSPQDSTKIQLHLEACTLCEKRYQLLTEFYQEFDEKAVHPSQSASLPPDVLQALQQKKKAVLSRRLTKTLTALAEKGADGVKDIKERAERLVERLTSAGPQGAAMPAIPKDAADVEEDEIEENDSDEPDKEK